MSYQPRTLRPLRIRIDKTLRRKLCVRHFSQFVAQALLTHTCDVEADRYEQIYKICLQDYHTVEYGQWDPPLSPVTHILAPMHLSSIVAGAKVNNDYGPVWLEEALR